MKTTTTARWSAIAVIAPLTAAAFAGTTLWAQVNDPRAITSPVAAQATSDGAVMPAQVDTTGAGDPQNRVNQSAEQIRQRAKAVRAKAREIRREARQIAEASTSTPSSSNGDSGSGSSSSSGWVPQGASNTPAPAPKPAPVVVPAPAPAPPADTTTGAS